MPPVEIIVMLTFSPWDMVPSGVLILDVPKCIGLILAVAGGGDFLLRKMKSTSKGETQLGQLNPSCFQVTEGHNCRLYH